LDSYAAIKAYLYTATMRLSQRYANKEYKRNKIHKEAFSSTEHADTAYDNLVRVETYNEIRASLQLLSPGVRQVIPMHFLEGKKINEIAAELNVAPCTVSVQKGQGLKALRKILKGS
jgi:RNA polymerase sigma factor (sigma-70 family)